MASRLPPAKSHGGRTVRGPASTKTLTTNTYTTTTGVSSSLHDPSVPRTYLFDIYKNEAESHYEIGEYRQAADCYNAAIKLQPSDTSALVARSRCYAQMGRWKRAMKDCDEALNIDASCPEAMYQKAEILYLNGNFDLALVYFKRGLRHQPDSILFKQAVQKASDAVSKMSGGGAGTKPSKLTAVGDLSLFLHNKKKTPRDREPTMLRLNDDHEKLELPVPSAGFRARFNITPLIRINRKPGVSILRSYRPESAKSGSSAGSATRTPSEATMRTILGELYGDRKYLKKFQNNLPGGKAERDMTLLADEGLEFLRERTMFWDSLGPLPPPQVPKRSNMRERSFFFTATESVCSTNENTPRITLYEGQPQKVLQQRLEQQQSQLTQGRLQQHDMAHDGTSPGGGGTTVAVSTVGAGGMKFKSPRRLKKKKLEVMMGLERDCTKINFQFQSLRKQSPRADSQLDRHTPEPVHHLPILKEVGKSKSKNTRTTFAGVDTTARDRKRELTKYINNEMDNIDEAFKNGEYEECRDKAEQCLVTVCELEDENINKSEVVASLHSCIGNASIARGDFDSALTHHMEALNIGETENLHEVINRSLGHLGRMYIIQKRFNKALEVFARKAPTVVSAEEVAQVFHEIGNCFLALGHLDYARDCGKKAFRAAEDAGIHYFKFQSWVLIAVSESRMKHHDEAFKAFQHALDLAKEKDDQESVTVILFAMEHLSKTITSIMKKRELLNERLMSRSKTQTIIDLNKRPHAARQKKRKKKLRREATSIEDDLTRQATMVEVTGQDEKEGFESEEPRGAELSREETNADDLLETPRVHLLKSNSFMFEESPRELEPFGDPNVRRERRRENLNKKLMALDHPETDRSSQVSRSHSNLDTSRDKAGSKSDHHETPRLSRMDLNRSKLCTPDSRADQSGVNTYRSENASPRKAYKHHDSSGGPSLMHTPRIERLKREPAEKDQDRQVVHLPPVDQKCEGHKSAGESMTHRKSSRRRSQDSQQNLTKKENLEPSKDKEESYMADVSNGNATGEPASFSTGAVVWNSFNDDLTPRRMEDFSVTQNMTVYKNQAAEDSIDIPREGIGTPGDGIKSGQAKEQDPDMTTYSIFVKSHGEASEKSQEKLHQSQSPMKAKHVDVNDGRNSGRFTRESVPDETEKNFVDMSGDASKSTELVSVSRQYLIHSRKGQRDNTMSRQSGQNDKPAQNVGSKESLKLDIENVDTPEKETKSREITPTPRTMERQSSRISMKIQSSEEAVFTLQTTKPYRVSSATSVRSVVASANPKEEADGNESVTPVAQINQAHAVTPLEGATTEHRNASPAKSNASAYTTGSGWEGDVSMDSEHALQGTKFKNRKKKPAYTATTDNDNKENKSLSLKEGRSSNKNNASVEIKTPVNSTTPRENPAVSKSEERNDSREVTPRPTDVTYESAGSSLKDIKNEVIKNTSEAPQEDQEIIAYVKEAYLEQRHADKVRRETRDLEDIQSVPYSSNAETDVARAAVPSRVSSVKDPALSTTLPVSHTDSYATQDGAESRASRPVAPAANERPESENFAPSSLD